MLRVQALVGLKTVSHWQLSCEGFKFKCLKNVILFGNGITADETNRDEVTLETVSLSDTCGMFAKRGNFMLIQTCMEGR